MPPTTLVFAGTESGITVFSFAGNRWQRTSRMLMQEKIIGITVDERHPMGMQACAPSGIFCTVDGGRTWAKTLAVPGASLVGAGWGTCFAGTSDCELWQTSDSGATWENISTPLPALEDAEGWFPAHRADEPIISALAIDQHAGTLAAGITVGGLIFSYDSGQHWTPADALAGEAVLQISAPQQIAGQWLARTEDGIFFSADGATWKPMDTGLAHNFCTTITQLDDGSCWAAAGDVPIGNWVENTTTELYHAERAGEAWHPISMPAGEYITGLGAMPNGKTVLAGTQNGSLWQRKNDGRWEKIGQATGAILSLTGLRIG